MTTTPTLTKLSLADEAGILRARMKADKTRMSEILGEMNDKGISKDNPEPGIAFEGWPVRVKERHEPHFEHMLNAVMQKHKLGESWEDLSPQMRNAHRRTVAGYDYIYIKRLAQDDEVAELVNILNSAEAA